ncbi:MAG: hypothetical protein SFX73_17230 [Kofleriaceae bacterium]|nr:hypothetical protein [Kofleriaceae bacterium]
MRPSAILRVAGVVFNVALAISYPVAIYWGLTHLGTRAVSVMVLALLVPGLILRFRRVERALLWSVLRVPIAILILMVAAMTTEDARFVLALPVAINAVLFAEFFGSLSAGQTPMIERFARMQVKELPATGVIHCRRWTRYWSAFFVGNGLVALALALWAPLDWWTLYTGAIAYGLMGCLFAVEWLNRPPHQTAP